jgi:voltage-gated potassium channel
MLFNYRLFSRVYYFLILLILITSGGTIGYMIIEEWDFADSFYMTIITMSTVGFGEVHELTIYGKLFTAFLIISSFGTFAYAITSITTYLVGGEYRQYFKEYKTMQELKKMNGHVIICGYGRVGMQVAQDLNAHGNEFIIIEQDEDIVMQEKDHSGFLFLYGDSTNDETLKNAGIESARAVITCLPKDADNTYVVLAAREFKRDILIVSRASYTSAVSKLRMAGANNVIMPDSLGGSHMASLIANPDVMEFLDIIRVQGYTGANIESIAFEELPEQMKGKTIQELDAEKITGVTIIGYRAPDGEYHINPKSDTVVAPNSRIFVLGSEDQIKNIVAHFHLKHK